jgi:hypothetical protein
MCNPPLPWTWPFPDPPSVCETSISSSFRSLSFIKPTPCTFLPLNHHFSGKHKIVSGDSNEPLDLGSGTKRQSCKKWKFYDTRNLKDWLPNLPLKTGKSKENQSFFITTILCLELYPLIIKIKRWNIGMTVLGSVTRILYPLSISPLCGYPKTQLYRLLSLDEVHCLIRTVR